MKRFIGILMVLMMVFTGAVYAEGTIPGVEDGVLIAVDASKDYLQKDQLKIADRTLAGKERDLNE